MTSAPPPACVTLHGAGSSARATILTGRGFACAAAILESPQGPRDVLWAPDNYCTADGRPSAGGIPILCPYPGRLASTTMRFAGRSFALPPGDALGRPIHGLVHDRAWRIVEQGANRVVGEFRLSRDAPDALACWPADFTLTATWTLLPNQLNVELVLLAHDTMPAAFGLHPYLPVPVESGGDPAASLLEVPARLWQPQQDLLPVGLPVAAEQRIGFPGRIRLAEESLDDPFCGLLPGDSRKNDDGMERRAGWIVSRVIDPQSGAATVLEWDPVFSACVIFTPPHRRAVCIEPYTVLPGQSELNAAAGWPVLENGESLRGEVSLRTE